MICLFGEDEEVTNPHTIAWQQKDWDAVKKLSEEFAEKPENELFVVLNAINQSKERLDVNTFENYSKFTIDRMLSKHIECLDSVYIANMILSGLDDQHHFDYLRLTIPRGKRYSKNVKIDESFKDKYILKLIMAFYKVNHEHAFEYKAMLTHKGKLQEFLKDAKSLATDSFLKEITKNPKEIKVLKLL